MQNSEFQALAMVRLERAKELMLEAENLLNDEHYKQAVKAEEIRSASDYDDFYIANKNETRELVDFSKSFYEKVEKYIQV